MKKLVHLNGWHGPFASITQEAGGFVCDGIIFPPDTAPNGSIEDYDPAVDIKPTPQFILDELAEQARIERDKLLTACDWTQVADAPVDSAAWAVYRQELRDVPEQEGFPENIIWPTEPE